MSTFLPKIIFLFVATCAALVNVASAQDTPKLSVGDHWKYQMIGVLVNRELGTLDYTVLESFPDRYVVEVRNSERSETTKTTYSSELNLIRSNGEDVGLYRMPLSVGKKWTVKATFNTGSDGKGRTNIPYVATNDREVVGLETIDVPAGKFEAYKIVSKTWNAGDFGYGYTGFKEEATYWFAPSVKRLVRYEEKRWDTTGKLNRHTRQDLLSYKLN